MIAPRWDLIRVDQRMTALFQDKRCPLIRAVFTGNLTPTGYANWDFLGRIQRQCLRTPFLCNAAYCETVRLTWRQRSPMG